MDFEIGDLVTRKSYGRDIIFIVKKIELWYKEINKICREFTRKKGDGF